MKKFASERVWLRPGRRYCKVWPLGAITVTDIILNASLLRCYIVTTFLLIIIIMIMTR